MPSVFDPTFRSVSLNGHATAVVILDQTLLPHCELYLELTTAEEVWEAIYKLRVRGAPAIGIAAAYGAYVCALPFVELSRSEFDVEFAKLVSYLDSSRPTAVNLSVALNRMMGVLKREVDASSSSLLVSLRIEAETIHREDIAACRQIGENGLALLKEGMGLLTHCNAGALSVSELGTALAPVYLGQMRGYEFKLFADETRPLLQGARLTAYELQRGGVDVTVICDNMASIVMSKGWVHAVLVGCDRVAMNGDTANKIGTSGVAILAKHYGIPFYVLGPTSTIDQASETGSSIVIEERPGEEISDLWYERTMLPKGVKMYNPAFDITPYDLITAIVTEKGVVYPPFDRNLAQLFA